MLNFLAWWFGELQVLGVSPNVSKLNVTPNKTKRHLQRLRTRMECRGGFLGEACTWFAIPKICNEGFNSSKNFPTDPWSIPQTPNQQFMFRNSFQRVWGCLGVCDPGVCWVSLRTVLVMSRILGKEHLPIFQDSFAFWSTLILITMTLLQSAASAILDA